MLIQSENDGQIFDQSEMTGNGKEKPATAIEPDVE